MRSDQLPVDIVNLLTKSTVDGDDGGDYRIKPIIIIIIMIMDSFSKVPFSALTNSICSTKSDFLNQNINIKAGE